ncbi:hypothetical protein [Bosea sp. (in: a-proteobacteria)]|uniref:hypothetical protein n=1 Tax=Bosea sp. (in: a-proteobacteria) TaxID=1871050 RepID=UPI001AD1F5B3|nr:hypothetical protein [Bosea sp. (in: a-proteobacteria)]MBN9437157.1 hypothetical protein [Bosea sp. (in: a-proteobacteria)]
MEGRDLTDAFRALFSDIPENSLEHDRPLLAHYTSIDALNKILTSNEIWLANPLFMNDHEELRWGILNGIEEFRLNETLQSYLRETDSASEFEFQLGSGLVDQSQKMTAAAIQMAEKKVWAHRS